MARTSAHFRLAAVISSAVLIALYVGWQAGAFQSNPPRDGGHFSSTKSGKVFEAIGASEQSSTESLSAPTFMPGSKSAPVHVPDNYFTNGGIEVPQEVQEGEVALPEVHAFSSKSAVPLVVPGKRGKPVLPSSKRTVPLITVPAPNSAKAPGSNRPKSKFSGTKSFVPLIDVPAKNEKSVGKPPVTQSKPK